MSVPTLTIVVYDAASVFAFVYVRIYETKLVLCKKVVCSASLLRVFRALLNQSIYHGRVEHRICRHVLRQLAEAVVCGSHEEGDFIFQSR